MRHIRTAILMGILAVCCGQSCDPQSILNGLTDESDDAPLNGINGGDPASQRIPEIGGPVTIQIISESRTDARVLVRFLLDDIEGHRSDLFVPALTTLQPIGPDLARFVEISGTFVDGRAIPPVRMTLGVDFLEGEFREVVLTDPDDECPLDPDKTAPGACGCGRPDIDTDGDGALDCVEQCPSDPLKLLAGICGCGIADADRDLDATADCIDGCPDDPRKTAPGTCGCGVPDVDTDGDGVPNCNDACPINPGKTDPGVCGCALPDSDTDLDGTFDCQDECPLDPHKTVPGACGCGQAEVDLNGNGVPDCLEIDSDDDGILDDGDFSGQAGDNPCTDSETRNCDDNCPYHENPYQDDRDSDGVGAVCEIRADFDNDGDVDMNDYAVLQSCLGGLSTQSGCELANLDNDPSCSVDQADVEALKSCLTGEGLPVSEWASPACWGEQASPFCYSTLGG